MGITLRIYKIVAEKVKLYSVELNKKHEMCDMILPN